MVFNYVSMQGVPLYVPAVIGDLALQSSNSVDITGGSISNITDLAVADGGTGASTAANARTNLGLDVRCLARVTFNGVTLAITSSYNVSGITSPAAGVYTINLANALASANYSLVAHAQKTGDYPRLVGAPISTRTTTNLLVAVSDRSLAGAWENVENIDVAIFGA